MSRSYCQLMDVCNPCQTVITQRGDFFSDQYMHAARQTLQDLMNQMQNSGYRNLQTTPGKVNLICQHPSQVDYLLAELEAWQRSGQSLGTAMSGVRHEDLFTTVFRFETDCLKMLVDVKGFQPFNLKLNVEGEVVELIASKEEASSNPGGATPGKQSCVGYMSRRVVRKYILPQKLVKECVQCSLSADGILFLCAPWQRC